MTEKENKVARYKLDVKNDEARVVEAKRKLDEGYKKGQARIAQVSADVECDYAGLKGDLERMRNNLLKAKADLELAESELARGFEK